MTASTMAEPNRDRTENEPPFTPAEAARELSVSYRSVFRLIGLEWIEYETIGSSKPIRRITRESVRRLLARRKGR